MRCRRQLRLAAHQPDALPGGSDESGRHRPVSGKSASDGRPGRRIFALWQSRLALYNIDRNKTRDTDAAGWMTGAPWMTGRRDELSHGSSITVGSHPNRSNTSESPQRWQRNRDPYREDWSIAFSRVNSGKC